MNYIAYSIVFRVVGNNFKLGGNFNYFFPQNILFALNSSITLYMHGKYTIGGGGEGGGRTPPPPPSL